MELRLQINSTQPLKTGLPATASLGGLRYSLPEKLLKLVFTDSAATRPTLPEEVQREVQFSKQIDPLSGRAGVWNGAVLFCDLLAPRQPIVLNTDEANILGMNPAKAGVLARQFEERVQAFEPTRRGYLGWLMTQPAFLDERDAIFRKYRTEFETHGLPQRVITSEPAQLETASAAESARLDEWTRFLGRWRLAGMVAPDLPIPLAPRLPDVTVAAATAPGQQAFLLPDIYAVQGQGILNDTLNDALHVGTPEHLGSWMNIVRKDNSAKNTIPTYGRRFQLQHFWRVLQQRFATLLHRKTGQLTTAFASYFVKSEDTIKGDLRHIKQKLGSNWAQRPAVFD